MDIQNENTAVALEIESQAVRTTVMLSRCDLIAMDPAHVIGAFHEPIPENRSKFFDHLLPTKEFTLRVVLVYVPKESLVRETTFMNFNPLPHTTVSVESWNTNVLVEVIVRRR